MAIENTIAGTILPNYRILRERNFWIEGEIYLPIHHQLWAVEDVLPNQIREIHSHPMALQQCSLFLSHKYPGIKWVETEDTALSASLLAKDGDGHRAVIASQKQVNFMDLRSCIKTLKTMSTISPAFCNLLKTYTGTNRK